MIRDSQKMFAFLVGILLIPFQTMAAAPSWKIIPEKSFIHFTATQNNSPITGSFKSFTGAIHFDPAQLMTSDITITVDTGSVTTSYGEVADTLKTPDWFDVKMFPHAVFKANSFTKMADNTYQAKGTLTLRDKTVPLLLTFKIPEYTQTNAQVVGSTHVKRTAFGVGKGEWSSTAEVKDDVQIDFSIIAVRG